jgi:hypothetical protein
VKTITAHTATLVFQRREQYRDTYSEDPTKVHWADAITVKVPHGVTRGWRNPRNWPVGAKVKVTIEVTSG